MLNKIKTIFKLFSLLLIVAIVLFIINRRNYISQAIPVYKQYLEQRDKWEKVNTGTYVYLDLSKGRYFFIQNNKLIKILRYRNGWNIKYVQDLKNTYYYRSKSHYDIKCFLEKKHFLIENKFNAIKQLILFDKMLEKLSFLGGSCSSESLSHYLSYIVRLFTNDNYHTKYNYHILYDNYYGYPIFVDKIQVNNKDKIMLGIPSPFYQLSVTDLIIFPKGTKFTDKMLKEILKYYKSINLKKRKDKAYYNINNTVGGSLIKSSILKKRYNTYLPSFDK